MPIHRFVGETEHPTPLSRIRTRRHARGTGTIPPELLAMARSRAFYFESGEKGKPEVQVSPAGDEGKGVWKISVPVSEHRGARPGLTKARHPAKKFLDEVKADTSFKSYRPDWIDQSPVPRIRLHERSRVLRRFKGGRVVPLWVYDSSRYAFEDDSWPWGLVGRIFNNDGFSGTGALVGSRTVVTAGHMVPWADSSWWMRFVPAYFNGTSLFGAGVESYVSDAYGYDTGGSVAGYDWAVLRLYEPLGTNLGYFGYNSYSDSWNDLPVWSNIGYPGDIDNAEEPAFQQGFTVDDTDGDSNGGEELESDNCDLYFGNSGGPIFAWWNNGTDPRIVGVVSGQETEYEFFENPFGTEKDNVFASGDGLANLCAWARSNWP